MVTLPPLPKLDTSGLRSIVSSDPVQSLENIKRTYGVSWDPIDRRAHDFSALFTGGKSSYEVENSIVEADTGVLAWIADKLGLKGLLTNGILLLFALLLAGLVLWAWFRKQSQ